MEARFRSVGRNDYLALVVLVVEHTAARQCWKSCSLGDRRIWRVGGLAKWELGWCSRDGVRGLLRCGDDWYRLRSLEVAAVDPEAQAV